MALATPLAKFTAKAQKGGVVLAWATKTEQGNNYFEVERSTDKLNFTTIGRVKGSGTTNHPVNYLLLDSNAPIGKLFYRLKQVSTDSQPQYSQSLMVLVQPIAARIATVKLHPNPAYSFIKLDMRATTTQYYSVIIISISGVVAYSMMLEGGMEHQLDISPLVAGKYLVKIQGNDLVQSLIFQKK